MIFFFQGRVKFKGAYEVLKENAVYQYLITNDSVDTILNKKEDLYSQIMSSETKDEEVNDETAALLGKKIDPAEAPNGDNADTMSTHNKKIPMHLCWIYLRSGSSHAIILVTIFIFAVTQVLCNGCDYWLAYW